MDKQWFGIRQVEFVDLMSLLEIRDVIQIAEFYTSPTHRYRAELNSDDNYTYTETDSSVTKSITHQEFYQKAERATVKVLKNRYVLKHDCPEVEITLDGIMVPRVVKILRICGDLDKGKELVADVVRNLKPLSKRTYMLLIEPVQERIARRK